MVLLGRNRSEPAPETPLYCNTPPPPVLNSSGPPPGVQNASCHHSIWFRRDVPVKELQAGLAQRLSCCLSNLAFFDKCTQWMAILKQHRQAAQEWTCVTSKLCPWKYYSGRHLCRRPYTADSGAQDGANQRSKGYTSYPTTANSPRRHVDNNPPIQ